MRAKRSPSPGWILTMAALAVAPILVVGLLVTFKMQSVLIDRQESAEVSAAYAGRLAKMLVQLELADRIEPVQKELFYANLKGGDRFESTLREVWLSNPLLALPQFAGDEELKDWATYADSLMSIPHHLASHSKKSGDRMKPGHLAVVKAMRGHMAQRAAKLLHYDPDTGEYGMPLVRSAEKSETLYRWIPVSVTGNGYVCEECGKHVSKIGFPIGKGTYAALVVSFVLPGDQGNSDGMFAAVIPYKAFFNKVVVAASRRWEEVQPHMDADGPELPDYAIHLVTDDGKPVGDDAPPKGWVSLATLPLVGVNSPLHLKILAPPASGLGDVTAETQRWMIFFAVAALALMLGAFWLSRQFMNQVEESRLRSHLLSNVSHELKTPLSLIRLYTETLESGRVNDEAEGRKFLGIVSRESKRLSHLIDNILNIQRIEQERKTYSYAQVRADKVVRSTVEAYQFQITELGFELKLDVDHDLPLMMLDEEAIAQALVNLLDNATKYSDTTKSINVRCVRDGADVCISVSDRGVGIPSREHDRIFENFYRVEKDLVHDVKGSGLGLPVVRHVAEAHGGRVELDSVPGKGSTFTLCLPVEFDPQM